MVLQDGLRGKIQVLHRLILVHQIALDQIAVFLAATIHQLEKNGRADGAGHHHEDDGGHIFRLEHPQGDTLCGDDEGHLTAADHAHADLDALFAGVTAQLGAQSTADHLGNHGHCDEKQGEKHDGGAHFRQDHFRPDTGKENGREEHIRDGLALCRDIGGP